MRTSWNRRRIIQSTAAIGTAAVAVSAPWVRRVSAADAPVLANSIRSLTNPYHATWNAGGAAFAKAVGCEYVTLVTEGNSEKGSRTSRRCSPRLAATWSSTSTRTTARTRGRSSMPARRPAPTSSPSGTSRNDLHPWDHDPNYVAHISFNGVPNGKAMAEALFKAMGGKGGIVALGGILSNTPAIERRAGLEEALADNPDVKLLDFQVANWSPTEALEKVNAWLTQYGDEINGIWAANDDMALGALEALRADGRAGKVPVTGIDGIQLAVEAVMAGEMAGTVAWDPFWQGGMGLSIGYHAKTGKFDPAKEPKEHREFYGKGVIITSANAKEFYAATSRPNPSSTGTTSGAGSPADPVRLSRRRKCAGGRRERGSIATAAWRSPCATAPGGCGSAPGRRSWCSWHSAP